MPYKRQGRHIYVKKGGEWKHLKTHPSVEKAKKHLTALKINVEKKGGYD